MQLSALKENLATVRTELKNTNEKISNIEQIKTEKSGLFRREIFYLISVFFIRY